MTKKAFIVDSTLTENIFDPPTNLRVVDGTGEEYPEGETNPDYYYFYEGDLEVTWDAVTPPSTSQRGIGGYYIQVWKYDEFSTNPSEMIHEQYNLRNPEQTNVAQTRLFTFTLTQNKMVDDNTGPFGDLIVRVYTLDFLKRLSEDYVEMRFVKKQLVPQNFEGEIGIRSVKLNWDFDGDIDHISGGDYFEIYRNDVNEFDSATKLGQTFADFYEDKTVTAGETYYYWINSVSLFEEIEDNRVPVGTEGFEIEVDFADTPDIALNAVTDVLVATPATMAGGGFDLNSAPPLSVPSYDTFDIMYVTAVTGDGYEYLATMDIFYSTSTNIATDNSNVELHTYMGVINATSGSLIPSQTEADYDGSSGNGSFDGGLGHTASTVTVTEDGRIVYIDAVDGSGTVTEFTLGGEYDIHGWPDEWASLYVREQATDPVSIGTGTGFILYPDTNNMVDESTALIVEYDIQTLQAALDSGDFYFDGVRPIVTFPVTLEEVDDRYHFYIGATKTRSDGSNTLTVTANFRIITLLKTKR